MEISSRRVVLSGETASTKGLRQEHFNVLKHSKVASVGKVDVYKVRLSTSQ